MGGIPHDCTPETSLSIPNSGERFRLREGCQMRPVDDKWPVTNPYGVKDSRYAAGYHTGVDFGCPVGTPVRAPQGGKVITAKYDDDYGNYVTIMYTPRKGDKKLFLLAHNSELLVKTGQTVKRGQVVAKSGESGNTRGAHVHAEKRHSPFG